MPMLFQNWLLNAGVYGLRVSLPLCLGHLGHLATTFSTSDICREVPIWPARMRLPHDDLQRWLHKLDLPVK